MSSKNGHFLDVFVKGCFTIYMGIDNVFICVNYYIIDILIYKYYQR